MSTKMVNGKAIHTPDTVADLIKKLQEFPQDMEIGMASDEEGNDYYGDFYPEVNSNLVIIYPGGRRMEIDDFETYINEEEDDD